MVEWRVRTKSNLEQWPSLTLEPFYIVGVVKVIPYVDHLEN